MVNTVFATICYLALHSDKTKVHSSTHKRKEYIMAEYVEVKPRPGRPINIGRHIIDPETNSLLVYSGMCPDCHGKVLLSAEQAKEFAQRYYYDSKSLTVRLLRALSLRRRI